MRPNKRYLTIFLAAFVFLAGCAGALQRGMLDGAYVSTARPSIMIKAANLPLLAAGEGFSNLFWTGMVGGLPIHVWYGAYGEGGLSPLAIVAQAQVPTGWYWDSSMRPLFSVDAGTEFFNGVTYQACTFIIDPANDPFGNLVTGVQPDGQPQLWITRYYAARFNVDEAKIIMEYREPLPEGITSLTALPLGQANLLAEFAQRARDAFVVANAPENPTGVVGRYSNNISWAKMGQRFLGTASQYDWLEPL